MRNNRTSDSNSVSFDGLLIGLLGVLFVGLKLTGFIDWPWWWVTLPFWGGIALVVLVFLVWFLASIIKDLIRKRK